MGQRLSLLVFELPGKKLRRAKHTLGYRKPQIRRGAVRNQQKSLGAGDLNLPSNALFFCTPGKHGKAQKNNKPLKSLRFQGLFLGAGTGFEPVTFRL